MVPVGLLWSAAALKIIGIKLDFNSTFQDAVKCFAIGEKYTEKDEKFRNKVSKKIK